MFEQYMLTRAQKSSLNGTREAKMCLSITKVGDNDMDVDEIGMDKLELLWVQILKLKENNFDCPIIDKPYEGYSDIMLQAVECSLITATTRNTPYCYSLFYYTSKIQLPAHVLDI